MHVDERAIEDLKREERRWKAWDLRLKGWSIRRIAKTLGVSHPVIIDDLKIAAAEVQADNRQSAEEFRSRELERLDAYQETLVDKILPPLLDSLDPNTLLAILDGEGEDRPSPDAGTRAKNATAAVGVLRELRSISQERAKLLGLYAPVQVQQETKLSGEVAIADLTKLSDSEIKEKFAELFR
jgi:hypothetical protein